MIYTQILGLQGEQKIAAIKDANGQSIDDAKIRTIVELGDNIPLRFGDPIQRTIEVTTDRPFGVAIMNEKGELVCCVYTAATQ